MRIEMNDVYQSGSTRFPIPRRLDRDEYDPGEYEYEEIDKTPLQQLNRQHLFLIQDTIPKYFAPRSYELEQEFNVLIESIIRHCSNLILKRAKYVEFSSANFHLEYVYTCSEMVNLVESLSKSFGELSLTLLRIYTEVGEDKTNFVNLDLLYFSLTSCVALLDRVEGRINNIKSFSKSLQATVNFSELGNKELLDVLTLYDFPIDVLQFIKDNPRITGAYIATVRTAKGFWLAFEDFFATTTDYMKKFRSVQLFSKFIYVKNDWNIQKTNFTTMFLSKFPDLIPHFNKFIEHTAELLNHRTEIMNSVARSVSKLPKVAAIVPMVKSFIAVSPFPLMSLSFKSTDMRNSNDIAAAIAALIVEQSQSPFIFSLCGRGGAGKSFLMRKVCKIIYMY